MDQAKYDLVPIVDCNDKYIKFRVTILDENRVKFRNRLDSLMKSNFDLHVKLIKFREKDTAKQAQIIKEIEKWHVIIDKNIDCDEAKSLLSKAFALDQADRTHIENDMSYIRVDESLFAKCGWPAFEKLGEQSIYQAFIVVQHSNLQLMQKYLTYFTSAVEKVLLQKSVLPLMIDRIEVLKGNPQIYGTQFKKSSSDGSIILDPIKNTEKIDSIRRSEGLNTLQEYLEFVNNK